MLVLNRIPNFDGMDYLMTHTENRVWEQRLFLCVCMHAYIHTHICTCVCVCMYSNEVRILYVFLSIFKTQEVNGLIETIQHTVIDKLKGVVAQN